MTNSPKAVPLGLSPSFGFGDRLGLATPGHLAALLKEGGSNSGAIRGIFAQQSIREMARTRRTPAQVMGAAADALARVGYREPVGADADHLKTPQDVDVTADAGFCFFTIDPSGYVDQSADGYDAVTLAAQFAPIRREIGWLDRYLGKTVTIEGGPTLSFDEPTVVRAAVKYGRAINHTLMMAKHIHEAAARRGMDYEIELSVDETEQPTTMAEHYIIANQLCEFGGLRGKLVSLAPRYVGDFEKGVDFKGDMTALRQSLCDHAAIARQIGPYKLSLHSGSDKLSMYGLFAKATRGCFHVKTAGTSYLEALRVVARHDGELFREVIEFSRGRYDEDKATYHVSASLRDVPPPQDVAEDHRIEQLYLECWEDVAEGQGFTAPGRQILHCTFGSVLTDERLGRAVRDVLDSEPATYRQVLTEHFARHLRALRAGM